MSSILYDSQTSVSKSTFLQSLESSQAYENDDHDRSMLTGADENLNFSQLMAKADNQGSILLDHHHHHPNTAGNGFPNGNNLPSFSTAQNEALITRTSAAAGVLGIPSTTTHHHPPIPPTNTTTHNPSSSSSSSSSMYNPSHHNNSNDQYHYKDEILSVSAARLSEETFQVRGFACRSHSTCISSGGAAPSSASNGTANNDLLTVQQVMNFACNPALLSRWCAPVRNITVTKESSSSTSRFQNQQQQQQQSATPTPPLHNNNKNQYEYDGEWIEGDAALVNPGSKCGLYNVSSMVLRQLSEGIQKASKLLFLPSTPMPETTRGSGAYMYSNPMHSSSNLSQQQQQQQHQQGNVTLFIERKRGKLAITMSPVGGCEVTYTLTFQQSSSSANTRTNTSTTRIGVQIINTVRVDRGSANCCYGAVVPRNVKEWVLPSMASHIQQGIDAMELLIQLVQHNANAGDVGNSAISSSSGWSDNSPTASEGGMYAGVLGTLSNAIGGRFGVDNSNDTKVPLLDATL